MAANTTPVTCLAHKLVTRQYRVNGWSGESQPRLSRGFILIVFSGCNNQQSGRNNQSWKSKTLAEDHDGTGCAQRKHNSSTQQHAYMDAVRKHTHTHTHNTGVHECKRSSLHSKLRWLQQRPRERNQRKIMRLWRVLDYYYIGKIKHVENVMMNKHKMDRAMGRERQAHHTRRIESYTVVTTSVPPISLDVVRTLI